MSALSDLIYGYRKVFFGGAELPQRGTVEFVGPGVAAADNDPGARTIVTIAPTELAASLDGIARVKSAQVIVDGDTKTKPHTVVGHLATADATPVRATVFTLTDPELVNVEAVVTVTDATAAIRGRFKVGGLAYRSGGGAAWQGGAADADPAPKVTDVALAATLVADGNDVRLEVTGLAATALMWGWEVRGQRQAF